MRFWIEAELAEIFGIAQAPAPACADAVLDALSSRLADDAYRPRAQYERFATCKPPPPIPATICLPTPSWRPMPNGRVGSFPASVPTRTSNPTALTGRTWCGGWRSRRTSTPETTRGTCAPSRRAGASSWSAGATSADHSHLDARTDPLEDAEARSIYRAALDGSASPSATVTFRRHMLSEMARMSCEDGLVMTLHCGVLRDHHTPTAARFGRDVGADIPVAIELTHALRPLLERFGTHPGFHLVVFTVDETVWSRELAPLAGFYPSVYAGAPWWFLDAPASIRRFRAALTGIVGFARTSGFIDDARSFCSIPARHDMSRRLDAGYLARLVAEHQLDLDEAREVAVELVTARPSRVFKL